MGYHAPVAPDDETISHWLEQGKVLEAKWMIHAIDSWNLEDYPVYVAADQSLDDSLAELRSHFMTGVVQVYSIN